LNGTQTLGRALDILFVLAEAEGTLTVSEIAEKVTIPESTAYRLIQTLEQNGIVLRKGKGQVGLGLRLFDLARSLHQQIDKELLDIARPIMKQLTQQTNETSILCIRSGLNSVCVENVESRRIIRMSVKDGRILPLDRGASGKVLLAFESELLIEQVLKTIKQKEMKQQLLHELEQIRKNGHCISESEVDSEVFAIAVPILDSTQRVVASLTLAGPVYRFNVSNIPIVMEEILEAVRIISQKMGQAELLDNLQVEPKRSK
jgi:DNA-binding IclR family transcriptional regulator